MIWHTFLGLLVQASIFYLGIIFKSLHTGLQKILGSWNPGKT